MSSRLERIGVPASLSLDVVWKCGDKLFLPIRLIEYNMLGIFGVIAWIGMEFILLAIASKFNDRCIFISCVSLFN